MGAATVAANVDRADAAAIEIRRYLGELVNARRAKPADDLISALVSDEDDEHQLSEEELVTMAAFFGRKATQEHPGQRLVTYPAGGEFVAKVKHYVSWGAAAPAGYFTAMLAGESATGRHGGPDFDAAFARERARQADWLRRELNLTL